MIRFGLVGVNTMHADAFSQIFNGSSEGGPQVDGGTISAIWGGEQERVDELAGKHTIAAKVGDPLEMIGQVDAVLVVDDTGGGATHADLARPFLEAGMPVFVDKPMTTSYDDAVELFAIAERTGAPLLSCSALRFAAELEPARAELERIGTLSSVVSVGPGDWFYYGVHAVELLEAVVGTGARSIHRHAFAQRDVAIIDFPDGPTAVVETLRDASYVFDFTAYGEHGHFSFEVKDHTAFYANTMREVVAMAETGISRSPRPRPWRCWRSCTRGRPPARPGPPWGLPRNPDPGSDLGLVQPFDGDGVGGDRALADDEADASAAEGGIVRFEHEVAIDRGPEVRAGCLQREDVAAGGIDGEGRFGEDGAAIGFADEAGHAIVAEEQGVIAAHAADADRDPGLGGERDGEGDARAVVGPLLGAVGDEAGAVVLAEVEGIGPAILPLVDAVDPGGAPHRVRERGATQRDGGRAGPIDAVDEEAIALRAGEREAEGDDGGVAEIGMVHARSLPRPARAWRRVHRAG